MRNEYFQVGTLLGAIMLLALLTFAEPTKKSESPSAATVNSEVSTENAGNMRVEGEKRFHANCGRCHMAPHKYSPKVMATAVRHMRVRATITDEDMRLILYFLTE